MPGELLFTRLGPPSNAAVQGDHPIQSRGRSGTGTLRDRKNIRAEDRLSMLSVSRSGWIRQVRLAEVRLKRLLLALIYFR